MSTVRLLVIGTEKSVFDVQKKYGDGGDEPLFDTIWVGGSVELGACIDTTDIDTLILNDKPDLSFIKKDNDKFDENLLGSKSKLCRRLAASAKE